MLVQYLQVRFSGQIQYLGICQTNFKLNESRCK